jgi:CBS domain-containing protein
MNRRHDGRLRGARVAPLRFASATVGDVMHEGVLSCRSDTPVRDVATMMSRDRVHAVVVDGERQARTRPGHHGWRVVSDMDIVGQMDRADPWRATAGQLAATPAIVVAPGEPLTDAARLMHDYDVHHLLVVEPGARRPIGVVSTLDVVASIAVELEPADA